MLSLAGLVLAITGLLVHNAEDEPNRVPSDRRDEPQREESVEDEGWSRNDLGGHNAVLVTDGERVCSTEDDKLFCVDGSDGEEIFSVDLPAEATGPTLAGTTLVVGADGGPGRGDVYGYSLDGDLLWEATSLQDVDVEQSVLLGEMWPTVGDVVAVPLGQMGTGGIAAIDARSGTEIWRLGGFGSDDAFDVVGTLLSDGHRFYGHAILFDSPTGAGPAGGVTALDPATGALLWQFESAASTDVFSTPSFLRSAVALDDGAAVAFGIYGDSSETVVVDTATGTVRWRVPMETEWGGLAHLDGVTVVSDGAVLRGYDAQGAELWSEDVPTSRSRDEDDTPLSPALTVAGGMLWVLDLDLVAVDPEDGDAVIVLPRHLPEAVAAVEDYLVVGGLGWVAVPLPGD